MKKTIIVGMAALLLLFGVVLAGCKHDSDDNGGSNPESIPPLNPPQVGTFAAVSVEDSGLTQSIWAMGYGGGTFVAGDDYGAISYSTDDGVTWTLATSQVFASTDDSITSFAYGNGTFVVTGRHGSMAYSRDAITWIDITATTEDLWKQTGRSGEDGWDEDASAEIVIFANGKFVAGGGNGVILYSTNGENWNEAANFPFGTEYIEALAYGNGKYIASDGKGDGFATSSDGITWTNVGGGGFFDIVYAKGKFITLIGSEENHSLSSSADGIAWKPVDTSLIEGTFTEEEIEYLTTERGGEVVRYMTVGSNSILGISHYQKDIVGSVDGTTWVKAGTTDESSDGEILSMVYGNGKFLFATRDAKIFRLVE